MSLDIRVEKKANYAYTVVLEGSIDVDTQEQLEEELKEIINENTRAIILDMAGVDYISSIGIRVVFWAKKELHKKNASFAMTNLQPQIKKVFEIMRILPMIDIFDDMPEADKYIDQIIKDETKKQNP
ncbi:MAG: STAS domain-containing protein [Candidatus Omnitrophota bacterium]